MINSSGILDHKTQKQQTQHLMLKVCHVQGLTISTLSMGYNDDPYLSSLRSSLKAYTETQMNKAFSYERLKMLTS